MASTGAVLFLSASRPAAENSGSNYRQVDPITIKGFVPGQGWVSVSLGKEWVNSASRSFVNKAGETVKDPAVAFHLQGTLRIGRQKASGAVESIPVAASIFRETNKDRVEVFFQGVSRKGGISSRSYRLIAHLPNHAERDRQQTLAGKIISAPTRGLANFCEHPVGAGATAASRAQPAVALGATLRVLELATDADEKWFAQFGAESNTRIAQIVNIVNAIYERDLLLTISLVDQKFYEGPTSPYTEDPNDFQTDVDLLEAFGANVLAGRLADADVYHLFAGNDGFSANGLAYVGTACGFAGNLQTGFSKTDLRFAVIIFAHEVGHNLSAVHDEADADFIMNGEATEDRRAEFSPLSKETIANFVRISGSCLASGPERNENPTPVPTLQIPTRTPEFTPTIFGEPAPTKPKVKLTKTLIRGKTIFTVTLTNNKQIIPNYSVTFLRDDVAVKIKKTNANGQATLRTKIKGRYKVSVVNADGTTVFSRAIRLS